MMNILTTETGAVCSLQRPSEILKVFQAWQHVVHEDLKGNLEPVLLHVLQMVSYVSYG